MNDKIKCPNCGHNFDVEEAISGKLEAHFKEEYERKVAEQADKFNEERLKLEEEKKALAAAKEQESELLEKKVAEQMELASEKLQAKVKEDYEQQLKQLEEENTAKKLENRKLKQQEVDLLQREKALKEETEDMQLNIQKELLEKTHEIENKALEKEKTATLLREKEFQKRLDDQNKLIDEMKRKAEQGSMQMQGEVQELALEELLAQQYPFDVISEVSKGIRGADCIQTVINSLQQECGAIVYESKRTVGWDNKWIAKLKQDQISVKADVAVIVTQTYPNGMDRFGELDGVWICGFHEVKSVSMVLRELITKTHSVKSAEENKGDKMELLYSYLTSNEFVQNIQRIVSIYGSMEQQLSKEKRSMNKIWAEREKQIWAVQENISHLFGSIKGIAGKELASFSVLELPEPEDSDE